METPFGMKIDLDANLAASKQRLTTNINSPTIRREQLSIWLFYCRSAFANEQRVGRICRE